MQKRKADLNIDFSGVESKSFVVPDGNAHVEVTPPCRPATVRASRSAVASRPGLWGPGR